MRPFTSPAPLLALTAEQRAVFYHQALVATAFMVAVLIAAGLVLVAFNSRKRRGEGTTSTPWAKAGERSSLEVLAKASAEQNAALERERTDRKRAQDEAMVKDALLHQSLEERVRLARDLHDGIIQSLYATGLTLESARRQLKEDPQGAEATLVKAVASLNGAIRDVRTCLAGLDRQPTEASNLKNALEAAVADLKLGYQAQVDVRVEQEAGLSLGSEPVTELLQIAREATSNALRHGRATQVTIRLQADVRDLVLSVQDNGVGFDPAAGRSGRGLSNMDSRAKALGGSVAVSSSPGAGTRVVLLLPVTLPHA